MYVCAHMHAYCQQKLEEHVSSETGVMDGCEPPCGSWELNPGSLEEQPVLLTTEPFLYSLGFSSDICTMRR